MSRETITIGKTGREKGYINHTKEEVTIRLDVDYGWNQYEVSGDSKLATRNRCEAEHEFGRLLGRQDTDFHPDMLEDAIRSMEIDETICVVVNRESQKFENEDK